jgi:hypothetical protein
MILSTFAIVWGVVALVGGLRCYFDSEHAGFFRHPAVGIVAITFPAAMMALAAAVGGDVTGIIFPLALATIMSAPLLAYQLVGAFARTFSPVSQLAPEPTDPLLRAKAAEDRADTVIAVERYLRLLEAEPSHKEARTRLADLLARTGRIEWSKEVVEKGMSLAEAGPEARAEWRALRLKWEEGKGVEAPSGEGPRLRGLEDSPTPRLDMHAEAQSAADDSAVPFDEGDEEEEADGAGEEDDDRPIPFP